jgi:hypothetical protein
LSQSSGTPDAATRFVGNDTHSAAAWFNGDLVDTAPTQLLYDSTRASANFPTGGALTPGDVNNETATPINNPPDIANQLFTINNKPLKGAVVGQVVADDGDGGTQTLTYEISAGNTRGAFAIDPNTGVLTVANPAKLTVLTSGETSISTTITVRVSDNGVPASRPASGSVTITLESTAMLRMSPTLSDQSFSIAENNKSGAVIGTVKAGASYAGQKITFLALFGADAADFTIAATTGVISAKPGVIFDYETKTTYNFQVTAADSLDNTKAITANVTVNIKNVNEAPVLAIAAGPDTTVVSPLAAGKATLKIDENTPTSTTQNGLLVATITATDQDQAANTLNYTLVGGTRPDAVNHPTIWLNSTKAFEYDSSTGQIAVYNAALLSYENFKSITLNFSVTDSGIPAANAASTAATKPLTTKAAVVVDLRDLNEAPVINTTSFSVKENNKVGAVVGTVSATDPDVGLVPKTVLTYSITSVTDSTGTPVTGVFAISSTKGTLTALQSLDYESNHFYTVNVAVSDNGAAQGQTNLQTAKAITINVVDVDELATFMLAAISPAIQTGASALIVSKSALAAGDAIGTVTARDVDAGLAGQIRLSVPAGGAFTIDPDGTLRVANLSKLVVGKSIVLTVSDADGLKPPLISKFVITIAITA